MAGAAGSRPVRGAGSFPEASRIARSTLHGMKVRDCMDAACRNCQGWGRGRQIVSTVLKRLSERQTYSSYVNRLNVALPVRFHGRSLLSVGVIAAQPWHEPDAVGRGRPVHRLPCIFMSFSDQDIPDDLGAHPGARRQEVRRHAAPEVSDDDRPGYARKACRRSAAS